jgi:hypothetical protein
VAFFAILATLRSLLIDIHSARQRRAAAWPPEGPNPPRSFRDSFTGGPRPGR